MARARNIKPSFFKNEDLAEQSYEGRLLFIGLWTLADREGRLEDRPKKIKMEIFPADNVDVDKLLQGLHAAQFILRYEADGRRFIQVVAFKKHQSPHFKEPPSTIPRPEVSAPLNGDLSPRLEHHSKDIKPEARPSSEGGRTALIPDSLIPDSRGKGIVGQKAPDAVSPKVVEVLQFLNAKTGRHYRPVPANTKLIAARLREGATVDDLRGVIAKKCREWGTDPKMAEYLRPATLFGAEKFAQYVGELGAELPLEAAA